MAEATLDSIIAAMAAMEAAVFGTFYEAHAAQTSLRNWPAIPMIIHDNGRLL